MTTPDSIEIMIDSREKKPLLFPSYIEYDGRLVSISTLRSTMPSGDYGLSAHPGGCLIERKGSQLELFKNFLDLKDQMRQMKAFARLRDACRHPYLLIEMSPNDLLTVRCPQYPHPELLLHRLVLTCRHFGFQLLMVPTPNTAAAKRKIGMVVSHVLLAHYVADLKNQKKELDIHA